MVLVNPVIEEWEVDDFFDFVEQFNLKEQVLKDYKITDIQDIITADFMDYDVMEEYLEAMPEKYHVMFIDTRHNGYFIIQKMKDVI